MREIEGAEKVKVEKGEFGETEENNSNNQYYDFLLLSKDRGEG